MRRLTGWLAVILIFIVPWEDSISVSSLGSLARLMGVVVATTWIATILLEGRFRKPHLFHAVVLLFFLWNFISISWSTDTESSIQRIKTYSQIFLLMLIFWEILQKPADLKAGLQAYILGAYVLIVSTFYNYLQGNVSVAYEGRYSATGVNAVDLALILILGMPVAMQLFFVAGQDKKGLLLKLVNLAYIPLAVFATLLTGSRTSLIAVIPFGIYIIVTQKIKPDWKIAVFGVLLITLVVMLPFIPTSITTRLGTLGSSIEAGDLGGRVALWSQALLIFSRHPILGLGGGTLDSAIGSAAHNTFVSVAAETGSIGFGLFFIILVITLFQAIKVPAGNSGLWVTVFLTWVIGVCSLSWEFRKLTWLFLNFIIIEANFTYEQLNIRQAKVKVSKKLARFLTINEAETKNEVG
jgi:O-antigen ligase